MENTMATTSMVTTAALTAVFVVGCATVSPPIERVERVVVERRPVKRQVPGRVVLQKMSWQGDTFRASLAREQLCYDATEAEVRHQRVLGRTSSNVALNLVIGGLLLGGGGVGIAVAPTLSDEPDTNDEGEESNSPRDRAYIIGAIAAAAGAVWAGYAAWRGIQAIDSKVGEPWTTREDVGLRPRSVCGHGPPPPGALRFFREGKAVGSVNVAGPAFELNLRSLAKDLCNDETDLGKPLRVVYVSKGGALTTEVAQRQTDECIRYWSATKALTTAEKKVAGAGTTLAGTEDLAEATKLIGEAEAAIALLKKTDRDRAGLARRITQVRARAEQVSLSMLDHAVEVFRKALAENLDQSIPAARRALALSRNIPAKTRETHVAVLGIFCVVAAEKGVAGVEAFRRLLSAVPEVQSCLQNQPGCPAALDHIATREAVAPLSRRIKAEVDRCRKDLAAASSGLRKGVTERTADAMNQALSAARVSTGSCAPAVWPKDTMMNCTATSDAITAAEQLLENSKDKLKRIQAVKTVRAWRKQFPRCRVLAKGLAVFNDMRAQGKVPPKPAIEKIEAMYRALVVFAREAGELDEATKEKVREACREAKCPQCP